MPPPGSCPFSFKDMDTYRWQVGMPVRDIKIITQAINVVRQLYAWEVIDKKKFDLEISYLDQENKYWYAIQEAKEREATNTRRSPIAERSTPGGIAQSAASSSKGERAVASGSSHEEVRDGGHRGARKRERDIEPLNELTVLEPDRFIYSQLSAAIQDNMPLSKGSPEDFQGHDAKARAAKAKQMWLAMKKTYNLKPGCEWLDCHGWVESWVPEGTGFGVCAEISDGLALLDEDQKLSVSWRDRPPKLDNRLSREDPGRRKCTNPMPPQWGKDPGFNFVHGTDALNLTGFRRHGVQYGKHTNWTINNNCLWLFCCDNRYTPLHSYAHWSEALIPICVKPRTGGVARETIPQDDEIIWKKFDVLLIIGSEINFDNDETGEPRKSDWTNSWEDHKVAGNRKAHQKQYLFRPGRATILAVEFWSTKYLHRAKRDSHTIPIPVFNYQEWMEKNGRANFDSEGKFKKYMQDVRRRMCRTRELISNVVLHKTLEEDHEDEEKFLRVQVKQRKTGKTETKLASNKVFKRSMAMKYVASQKNKSSEALDRHAKNEAEHVRRAGEERRVRRQRATSVPLPGEMEADDTIPAPVIRATPTVTVYDSDGVEYMG